VEINRKVEKRKSIRKSFSAECRTYMKQRNPHRVLVGKFERNCPHGRREHRVEDHIKGDVKGRG
jgi:hypothetical protein